MSITVKAHSSVEADPEGLRDALLEWLPSLPAGASLSAMTRDVGSQRDPITMLVGMRADWQEQR